MAYGLGERRFEEQPSAVDAMLVLAARGQLDAAGLGRDIAEPAGLRRLKPKRVVAALREAARSGAGGTVWAVLSGALPGLLAGGPGPFGGALLALAADCAERSGPAGRHERSTSRRRARGRHSCSRRPVGSGRR